MRKTLLTALLISATTLFTSCNSYGEKVTINDHLEVYVKKDATKEEGKKLGEYLQSLDVENKNEKSIQLLKENNQYTVRLITPDEALKNTELESSFQALQMLITENVFPGKTVTLILTDDNFKDKKTIKELDVPAEQASPSQQQSTIPDSLKKQ